MSPRRDFLKPGEKGHESNRDLQTYGNLGLEILVTVLIGAFVGYWLDGLWGTRPWLMLIGFMAGFIAGFLNIFKLVFPADKGGKKGNKNNA